VVVVVAPNVVMLMQPQDAGQNTDAKSDAQACADSSGRIDVGHIALFVLPSGHVISPAIAVVVTVVVVLVATVVVVTVLVVGGSVGADVANVVDVVAGHPHRTGQNGRKNALLQISATRSWSELLGQMPRSNLPSGQSEVDVVGSVVRAWHPHDTGQKTTATGDAHETDTSSRVKFVGQTTLLILPSGQDPVAGSKGASFVVVVVGWLEVDVVG
jgi:hypothetical protein